ncbi:MAG TPA: S9 family peptidase [Anaerolineae bacterium]|nr:S9 family peptidase [Anaerolineae bacterium]
MTDNKTRRQFGLWDSPISPVSLAQGLRFSDVAWDSDGRTLVWLEWRSDRGVLVAAPMDGQAPKDITSELSVRAKVGYGGGDFTVASGNVYFIATSGRIYRQSLQTGEAQPLTPEFGHAAAPTVSPDGRWVLFVHSYEHTDVLGIVDSQGQHWPQKLVSGDDFYMQPRWHPSGQQTVWIAWNHPLMPWEGTYLRLGQVSADGDNLPRVAKVETLAGGEDVAIFQPEFSPDGRFLAYISNETGWGNLYLYDLEQKTHVALTQDEVEHGRPAWIQGLRTYGFSHDGRAIYYLRNEAGFAHLWRYDLTSGQREPLNSPLKAYTWLEQIALSPTEGRLAFVASAGTIPPRIVSYEVDGSLRVHRRATTESVSPTEYAVPQAVSWQSAEGESVHGLYYPPTNSRFEGIGRPPAIVHVHGGPTSQSVASFHPNTQFFTSRGYAMLEVNYRGSTGYGKQYMDALQGNWGIYDVADSVSGAKYLVDSGLADPDKLVIMGGSAGGYTVLQTLIEHPGFFKAGVCLFGVSNMFTLAAETHKFEERYLDTLLGPLPEAAAIYRARSPIFSADRIQDPIAIFQGEEDQVVPRSQSDSIVASLEQRGVPHEYHVYPGEGHGWRKSETIEAFYKAVDAFLRQYVIFA